MSFLSKFAAFFGGKPLPEGVEQLPAHQNSFFDELVRRQVNTQERQRYQQSRSTLRGPSGETYDPFERLPNPFERR